MKMSLVIALTMGCLVARADTLIDLGAIKLTLPAGYTHVALKGDDSVPGEIHVQQPKLKITYDVGLMAGAPPKLQNLEKGDLAALVYYEETKLNGIDCYFMAFRHSDGSGGRNFSLMIPRTGSFTVEVRSYEEMVAARSAFTKIKFSR